MNLPSWKSLNRCSLSLIIALACTLPILAQQTLGSLNGTVIDPSGAAVPGATVTVTNAAINVTQVTTTQRTGFFQIFNLPVGSYTVKVGHEGFDTTEIAGISIQEAQA